MGHPPHESTCRSGQVKTTLPQGLGDWRAPALVCLAMLGGLSGMEAARAGPSLPAQQSERQLTEVKDLENRADLYMVRKYYPEAVGLYRELVKREPRNASFYNKLGIAYHQMQNFKAAKDAYRKAIELNPDYPQAINNLAAVEYAQKNYRSAIFNYLKALELSPSDAVMYSNLGTAYFAYERFEYAMTSYRYALLLDPTIFQRTGRTGSIVHQRDIENVAAFNFYMAKTYASLGLAEETLLYLRKAWEEGFPDILKAVQDKDFAFLAEDPRFLQLLELFQTSPQEALAGSSL